MSDSAFRYCDSIPLIAPETLLCIFLAIIIATIILYKQGYIIIEKTVRILIKGIMKLIRNDFRHYFL